MTWLSVQLNHLKIHFTFPSLYMALIWESFSNDAAKTKKIFSMIKQVKCCEKSLRGCEKGICSIDVQWFNKKAFNAFNLGSGTLLASLYKDAGTLAIECSPTKHWKACKVLGLDKMAFNYIRLFTVGHKLKFHSWQTVVCLLTLSKGNFSRILNFHMCPLNVNG